MKWKWPTRCDFEKEYAQEQDAYAKGLAAGQTGQPPPVGTDNLSYVRGYIIGFMSWTHSQLTKNP